LKLSEISRAYFSRLGADPWMQAGMLNSSVWPNLISKAGEEVRTLDIQLGKLTLYQLSYARERQAQF
jgi:hypothetical protein